MGLILCDLKDFSVFPAKPVSKPLLDLGSPVFHWTMLSRESKVLVNNGIAVRYQLDNPLLHFLFQSRIVNWSCFLVIAHCFGYALVHVS